MKPEGSLPCLRQLGALPYPPILSQMHPVHTLTPRFFNIRFNIILQSMPRFSNRMIDVD